GGDVEAVLAHAADDAVVADVAVVAEQQAVAAAPRRELGPWVGVHAVHELDRVGADDLDLAQRRGVEDADACPNRAAFARDGGVHVLARLREVPRPAPLPDGLERRAVRRGPAVDPRLARDLEMVAAMIAGENAEGGGR